MRAEVSVGPPRRDAGDSEISTFAFRRDNPDWKNRFESYQHVDHI